MFYLMLWKKVLEGIVALLLALILPVLLIISLILPYGLTCLITGWRLKKDYTYLYFLPRFVKELTRPFREELL